MLLVFCASMLVSSCATEEDYPLVAGDSSDQAGGYTTIDPALVELPIDWDGDEEDTATTGTSHKNMDSQARYWGKKWCDMGYQELGPSCTASHYNYSWRTGCYNWMDSTVDNTPTSCKDEFKILHQCEVSGVVIDPWPPGGNDAYIWGNDGCWGCSSSTGLPQLLYCDRCGYERTQYVNCI
jgi:hypothetical protein